MARHTIVDRTILEAALIGLEHQKSEIDAKAGEIRRMLRSESASSASSGPGAAAPKGRRAKRVLSPAARKRIADATKKRWAEYRAVKAGADKKASPKKKAARKKGAPASTAQTPPAAAI